MSPVREVTVLLVLASLATTAAGEPATADSAQSTTQTGIIKLTGMRLPDLDGTPVDLDSFQGQGPLVLDFWATWCKPCIAELSELNELYRDLAPRGLQVVAINEDGQRNAAKVKPFVKTQGYTFPVLLDLNREIQSRLHAPALPTTLLLDADGRVVHTSFGYRAGEIDVLRTKIESLLAEPASK